MIEILLHKKDNTVVTFDNLRKAYDARNRGGGMLWVDIKGFDEEVVGELGRIFGFHPLAIEDCIGASQRPKIDSYDGYIFVILHAAQLKPKKFGIATIELNSFIGRDYVVTVHETAIPSIDAIKERCRKNPALIRKGPSDLFYSIVDAMVDNYFPILDKLDKKIDSVEQGIFDNPGRGLLNSLFSIKNDILALRRIIGPQRETINFLAKGEYPIISQELALYYRDVSDQLARIIDLLETYRDILSSAMDGYMTSISNRTNEVMKILTIIATIVMPLTLITGIYGMNFKHMPELQSQYGYYATLFVMFAIAAGMLIFFNRKKWL